MDKRKVPLNEDEETRRKIEAEEHEIESRADVWQTFKVIGIFVLAAIGLFCFVVNLGDPAFLITFGIALIASSFAGKNKLRVKILEDKDIIYLDGGFFGSSYNSKKFTFLNKNNGLIYLVDCNK